MHAPTEAAALWETYGRHAEVMLGVGPRPMVRRTPTSFAVLSGAGHVDLNQAVLFGGADRRTAADVAAWVDAAAVPCLLGVSSSVEDDVDDILRDHGFVASPAPEVMFASTHPPAVRPHAFGVRRVRSADERAALARVVEEAHGYERDLVASMYGETLLERSDVEGWLAWDGDEPISCVFVTRTDGSLCLFDMLTSARHRRRGAGRAVLATALTDAWGRAAPGVRRILFWSSPAGRPLYESMGFTVADQVTAWTLGASPEDLAAVGVGVG